MIDASANYLAVIKVVGVGGGGTNAVNRMVDAGLMGVEFIAVNTDAQALQMCDADVKIHIGSNAHAGPRRRREPEIGTRRRGEPRRDQGRAQGRGHGLRHRGEGGGTGTGAAPVVAEIAKRDRRAHRRRGHEAVRLRGQAPRGRQAEEGIERCASRSTR